MSRTRSAGRRPKVFATPVPLAMGADKLIRAEMPGMTTMRLKELLGPWLPGRRRLKVLLGLGGIRAG